MTSKASCWSGVLVKVSGLVQGEIREEQYPRDRWVNLHDEMGAQEQIPIQRAVSLFAFSLCICTCGHLTCCIQSCVPLLVSCSQILWAESVRATAHTFSFTSVSLWFICHHKKHIQNVLVIFAECLWQSLFRRTCFVSDNIWTTKKLYTVRGMITSIIVIWRTYCVSRYSPTNIPCRIYTVSLLPGLR